MKNGGWLVSFQTALLKLKQIYSVKKTIRYQKLKYYLQVIQKRFEGLESFNKTFESYKNGFGSLDGEHWLGGFTPKSINY